MSALLRPHQMNFFWLLVAINTETHSQLVNMEKKKALDSEQP